MGSIATAALRGWFTGWVKGRLKPLPFALLFAVAMTATYLFSFSFVEAFENPALLDRRSAASASRPLGLLPWGQALIWLSIGLLIASVLAGANVMAKRFRDMGLPGGLATCMLAIMMIVFIGGGSTLSWAKDLFVFTIFLVLLWIPTDHLEAGSGLPRPGNDVGGS